MIIKNRKNSSSNKLYKVGLNLLFTKDSHFEDETQIIFRVKIEFTDASPTSKLTNQRNNINYTEKHTLKSTAPIWVNEINKTYFVTNHSNNFLKLERVLISKNASLTSHAETQRHYYKKIVVNSKNNSEFRKKSFISL